MNEIKKEVEEEKDKINKEKNKTPKKSTKKIKKKKKVKKKKPEKEYKNLKELLDDINKEKEEKLLKEKKLKEKEDKKKEKEEEKDKEEIQIKENVNITNSISTTAGTLSLDDFMPNYLLINNNDNSENDLNEEDFIKKRKMSSPIFDYYNGYDKFFSQEKEGSIDLKNSVNFVEKNKFISSCELNLSKLNINPKESDVKDKNVNNNNKFNENDNSDIKYNNNIYSNEEINYMNYYYDYYPDPKFGGNNDIQNMINHINNNIVSSYYSLPFSYNNRKPKKKFEKINKSRIKKGNNVRIGDWTCSFCYNLNFSFRKSCNRCNAPKQVL